MLPEVKSQILIKNMASSNLPKSAYTSIYNLNGDNN